MQQGGELAYLLLHDPEYRRVRREHLVEVGTPRIRLKPNLSLLSRLLGAMKGHRFSFYVISAAPVEVIRSALNGIVPEDRIFGTRFRYEPGTGKIQSIDWVPAGYGKVACWRSCGGPSASATTVWSTSATGTPMSHVMLHVNRLGDLTIAASENRYLTPIARRTILSDDGLCVMIPILEEESPAGTPGGSGRFSQPTGLVLEDWDKIRTDTLRSAARRCPDRPWPDCFALRLRVRLAGTPGT